MISVVKKLLIGCDSNGCSLLSFPLQLAVLLLLAAGYACNDSINSGELEQVPTNVLDTLTINEIDTVSGADKWVLSTNNGVFIVENDQVFRAGMQGKTITNLVVLDEQTMLASIPSSGENGETTLFRTTNAGESWSGFMRNWGGDEQISVVTALTVDPNNSNRVFGRAGGNVAMSINRGRSWESIRKSWDTINANSELLKINTNDPDIIWAGGANAFFQPILFKSEDGGQNWTGILDNLQVIDNFNFEGVVKDLVIDKTSSNNIIISMNRSLFKSKDGGNTWNLTEEIDTKGFDVLGQSTTSEKTIYASAINDLGFLGYAVSKNFGDNWEIMDISDSPENISVNDLIVVNRDGMDLLLFGTNRGFFSIRTANQ